MDPQDEFYELKVQETVIKKYLEETTLESEKDLLLIQGNSESNCIYSCGKNLSGKWSQGGI